MFVECHNSTCILYMCVIKNRKRALHAQWDQPLLTNGASWWHNNGVGENNTQHREKDSRGVEQRDRKRKKRKSEMNEVESGFRPWSSGTRRVMLNHQSRRWHGPQGKGTLATLQERETDAEKQWTDFFPTIHLSQNNEIHTVCVSSVKETRPQTQRDPSQEKV